MRSCATTSTTSSTSRCLRSDDRFDTVKVRACSARARHDHPGRTGAVVGAVPGIQLTTVRAERRHAVLAMPPRPCSAWVMLPFNPRTSGGRVRTVGPARIPDRALLDARDRLRQRPGQVRSHRSTGPRRDPQALNEIASTLFFIFTGVACVGLRHRRRAGVPTLESSFQDHRGPGAHRALGAAIIGIYFGVNFPFTSTAGSSALPALRHQQRAGGDHERPPVAVTNVIVLSTGHGW